MLFRLAAMFLIAISITGCRLILLVYEGGNVASASGARDCSSGSICNIAVLDTNFYEEFSAQPSPGWEFVKWREGNGYQCPGSTNPLCIISNRDTAGVPLAESIVASNQKYFLSPVFRPISGATSDVIQVGNILLAQPDLFVGVSWADMAAACPGGVCNNYLNGVDLRGWTWASLDDMNGLFNLYIGALEMGPGPDLYSETPFTGALNAAFFSQWRTTATKAETDCVGAEITTFIVAGRVWDSSNDPALYTTPDACAPFSWLTTNIDFESDNPGGWFYRTP